MEKETKTEVPAQATKRELEVLSEILLLLAEFGDAEGEKKAKRRILNAVNALFGWSSLERYEDRDEEISS